MSNRAHQSCRESAGAKFLGSNDFPRDLIETVKKRDPKGILFGGGDINLNPTEIKKEDYRTILGSRLKNKKILVCSGSDDKLVPYFCTEPFLKFLKLASQEWYPEINLYIEDKVYPNVGHTFTNDMLRDSIRFVTDSLNHVVEKHSSKV